MKKSRFTEEQTVAILRDADNAPVPEVARKHKVSAQAIYTWRRRFGELQPADVRRLRQPLLPEARRCSTVEAVKTAAATGFALQTSSF
jgi:transposase-like protein